MYLTTKNLSSFTSFFAANNSLSLNPFSFHLHFPFHVCLNVGTIYSHRSLRGYIRLYQRSRSFPFANLNASHFTITQTPKPQPVYRSPVVKYANALRKYRNVVPFSTESAPFTAPGLNGTVPAIPTEYDVEFLSPVTIGNQTLNVDFDTGSADL